MNTQQDRSKSRDPLPRPPRAAQRVAALALLMLATGCHPASYRQQADNEAYCIVDSKSAAVGVAPGQYRINVDPRSRMYDPHNPDCEPMPPDDPVSHQLMQCVDCKKGSKCWRCLPHTPFVENPSWREHLPYDEHGKVVLDLQGAVDLALLESPRYQSELEELYLSALDVTFERFRFDCQFFGGSSIFFTADGERRSDTGAASSLLEVSPLRPGNRIRAERLTATGGELVIGLANSLVWQFAGPNDYSSNTLLDFSLVQPLLRASGRGRVLERLTITERSLLANVRQMERFRRNFYVSVVTGDDPGEGASRRGGFFGGSGLEGFSGVGGGGFGRVGSGQQFVGQNFSGGNTGGAGAQGAGGYLGLLQSEQVLRNQRNNVAALRDSVQQLQASYEAGRIDRFQVDLARQALYNAQSQLLTAEAFYQTNLENFKVGIGLPPELDVTIRDTLLDPLNLLDPELDSLQQRLADTLDELRQLRADQSERQAAQRGELVIPNLPAEEGGRAADELRRALPTYLAEAALFRTSIQRRVVVAETDFRRLSDALPRRRDILERLADRSEMRDANIDPALFSVERLEERVATRRDEFAALRQRLAGSSSRLEQLIGETQHDQTQLLNSLISALTQLSGQLLELSLAQAGARLEAISFEPVQLRPEQALAIASAYRRDWKNARASLVDAWRLIYFNANDLQSDLDLVFSGDLGNVGDNPFRFRGTNGRLRVGLEFDAPLTRLAERNVYRQSLIEYQQARRSYYQFRDRVYQNLRNTLRQIRLNEVNFELRRAAVQVAISQVDLTQLRLSEPPRPGATSQFGNTTARDLVQSLSDLLNVQNDFLSVWVNYEVQRLNLEVNLGIMEVTPNGLRIENNIPLESYLVDLPINSEDLGADAVPCEMYKSTELSHPATVKPELVSPAEQADPAEQLPAPESSGGDANILRIRTEIPWPAEYQESLPIEDVSANATYPLPLPMVPKPANRDWPRSAPPRVQADNANGSTYNNRYVD